MGKYGEAAIIATGFFRGGRAQSPREAWEKAVALAYPKSVSSRKKGCPRNAYLGLCEEGLVSGVPAGKYTRSEKSKQYAVEAVGLLKFDPSLAGDASALWRRVAGDRKHNGQMDVVIELWKAGVIEA
jgi:hypothetical protein